MRPHISFSELCEFANNCQHRWNLNYLQSLRAEVFSVHFDFGTSVHEAIESYLTKKNPVSEQEACDIFKRKMEKLYSKNGPKYEKPVDKREINQMIEAGVKIILGLKDCPELQDAEVVHNEYPLFEKIDRDDDVDMKFKGFIDIVIKGKDKRGKTILWVCDFKTCSWGWDVETRQDRWKQYQLFLYKYYLCKKFDIDPKDVRTAFILLKKRPPKGTPPVEFFPVSAGPVSVQRALDALHSNLTEMKKRVENGDFVKNRDQCQDKYGNTCPFYKTDKCT